MEFVDILNRDLAAAKERLNRLVQAYSQITSAINEVQGEIKYCMRKLAERAVDAPLAAPSPAVEGESPEDAAKRRASGDLRPGDPEFEAAREREEAALGKFKSEVHHDELARALQG